MSGETGGYNVHQFIIYQPLSNVPFAFLPERFFMNTAAECCNFYFPGKTCNTINVCGDRVPEGTPTTPAGTAVPTNKPTNRPTKVPGEIPTSHKNDVCHPDKKWHADTTLGKNEAGCVNNDSFPPGWDKVRLFEATTD
jgi:hypothetical protein